MEDYSYYVPRRGKGALRLGNGDKLVIMDHFGTLPKGPVCMDYGVFFLCTAGQARLDYDGLKVEMHEGDLFLYYARSVIDNMTVSSDFDCREVWFSRDTMWDMNTLGKKSLMDLVAMKQNPVVSLSGDELSLLDDYFRIIVNRMRAETYELQEDVVHTILGAMFLDMLGMIRRGHDRKVREKREGSGTGSVNSLRGKQLADRYVKLVEECDGRVRRVDEFARMLNVTPGYLIRQLKETIGRTPSCIIALFTAKAIEYRLRFTDMTMQQIADDLHFANASFFGRYVKERFGMTPMEYRAKYQNAQI